MVKILILAVVMAAAVMTISKKTEAAAEVKIRLGEGFHLEDNRGIVYESSVPLVYELRWEEVQFPDQEFPDMKWSHCFKNSTCILAKVLADYQKAVSEQLKNMDPKLNSNKIKQKRFSVIGWILNQCCGVATQDDFEMLYKTEDKLETHIKDMKSTVHADHQSLTELATNADTLTKDFNGILDQTKHQLTDIMISEINFQEREEMLARHILAIYKYLHKLIQNVKKNVAANTCQNKKIPATVVQPKILQADLINITVALQQKQWELAVPVMEIGKYYGLDIASCTITTERIIIRLKIPIRRANRGWRSFNASPIPVGDLNSTCWQILPSKRVVVSQKMGKMGWLLEDKHCQPEINKLCFIPRDFLISPLNSMKENVQFKCESTTNTIIKFLENEKFAVINPPDSFQVHCGQNKQVEFFKLPAVSHGYLEIHVPCDCVAIFTENLVIEALLPCDNNWSKNIITYHVIPDTWTNLTEPDVLAILSNETLSHQGKLDTLLETNWELRSKTIITKPEEETPETVYNQVKRNVSKFHMEWTTVITILVLVVMFREPLNELLMRIVSRPPPNRADGFQRPSSSQ